MIHTAQPAAPLTATYVRPRRASHPTMDTTPSPILNYHSAISPDHRRGNSQMGGINIERREGRSNLLVTERDGTRLVNSSECQSREANTVS